MKKQIVVILLLIVLTSQSITAQQTELSKTSCSKYGIDLNKSYSGQELEAILDIVKEEADYFINHAYAEGYKAGLKESEPDKEYYKVLSQSKFNNENKTLKLPWWSNLISASVAAFLTYSLMR